MLGILTEKPSAMRNFMKALGGSSGTYHGESFVLCSAAGHLYEYKAPAEQVPRSYQNEVSAWSFSTMPWDETQFRWKREAKDGSSSMLKQIKQTLSGCDEIAIATDVDPTGEGQLLAWEILDELGLTKGKKISRFLFMDESAKEIQKAFVNRQLLPPMRHDPEYMKAEFRSQWDLLSMQFTRVATLCSGRKAVLRQGRLKSVMVQLTGDGLKAVAEYKKVPFFMNKFKDENGVIYTNSKEPRYPDKSQVPQTYVAGPVVKDDTKMMRKAPPKLLDLAGLSSRLSSQGFKAKDVLAVYQKMYEKQIVSYPRTEDSVITPEQFTELLPLVDKIAGVVGVDPSILTHRTPRSTHVKTGGAHGANRPGPNVPDSLDSLLVYGKCGPQIYEILARNYLAMLAEDYEYESQKGHVVQYPDFKGTASVPKKDGWKAVFSDDSPAAEDENKKGIGTQATPFIAEGANPKPPTPTMKWLMRQLEKCDVGTGATRTSTFADVTNSKTKYPLLTETRGKLGMTEYGQMSYTLLKDTLIGDVKTTEKLQQQMRDVAAGKVQASECLHQVQDMVRHDMDAMKQNAMSLGGNVVMSERQDAERYSGVWNGEQVSFKRVWGGHTFSDAECERLCNGETIVVDGLVSKKGSTYAVEGKLSRQTYNGHSYVGFERLGFANSKSGGGNKYRDENGIPYQICGHEFTEGEREMLAAGKTIYVEKLVSKAGKQFSANLHYGEDDSGSKKILFEFV